jgi:S-(hydroxymethyl)glutathione dehydrogenase/alcohol dehydrogenase
MQTFKAAVLVEQKKPLLIMDLIHKKVEGNMVKVKMISSGLCGAQVNEISGKKGEDKFLPHLMGHEGYGEVVEIGENVKKVKPGDFVILHWRPAVGGEMPGIKYESIDNISIGAGPVTTFSEYTIVAENRCTTILPNDSLSLALPLLGCAISTSYGAIILESKAEKHEKILIYGAGGLGSSLLFWLNVLGYKNVVVFEILEQKRNIVESYGFDFCSSQESISNSKFDVIFETTGVVNNIQQAIKVTNKGARIILIGQSKIGESVVIENFLSFYNDITMLASKGGSFNPDLDMKQIYEICTANSELFNNLISHTVALEDINIGFDLMKDISSRRVVIDFTK